MSKRRNNNNDNSTNDDNRFLSLHTDQQSLILGEMINARHRLEEENAELREQLQEAELIIQLLKLKLSQAKKIIKEFPTTASSEEVFVFDSETNNNDVNGGSSPPYWRPFDKFKRLKSQRNNLKKKRKTDPFANTVVPGKRTFFAISSPNPTKTSVESKPTIDKTFNNDTSEDHNDGETVLIETMASLQIDQLDPIAEQFPQAPRLVSRGDEVIQISKRTMSIRKQQQQPQQQKPQQQNEEEEKEEIQEVQYS